MFIINQTMRRRNIHRGGHKARAGTRHRPYTHPRRASKPFGNGHRPGPGVRAPLVGALVGIRKTAGINGNIHRGTWHQRRRGIHQGGHKAPPLRAPPTGIASIRKRASPRTRCTGAPCGCPRRFGFRILSLLFYFQYLSYLHFLIFLGEGGGEPLWPLGRPFGSPPPSPLGWLVIE